MQGLKIRRIFGGAAVALLVLGFLGSCGQGTGAVGGISYGATVINAPTPHNDATANATVVPSR
ncbi:MAG: hypothetical protein H0X37_19095 [Herpetosiphonaceae bacterium]|nr:hypothetical protein [Herpetosiphonaceae bacterium]